jgi:acid phosphatase (class A)
MTRFYSTTAAAALCLALAAAAHAQAPATAPEPTYLTEFDLDAVRLVAAPAADGSVRQTEELAQVRRLIATRSPERLSQAVWDAEHENASIYQATLGPAFDLAKLPATAALLHIVDTERKRAEGAKDIFLRKRPWAFDPSIVPCDNGQLTKKPASSYPSGHSLTGYSLGLALASLIPEKAAVIEARAGDYAYSREVCGAHYHSDTEASHVLAVALVTALFAKPQITPKIDAARAELRAAGLTAAGS